MSVYNRSDVKSPREICGNGISINSISDKASVLTSLLMSCVFCIHARPVTKGHLSVADTVNRRDTMISALLTTEPLQQDCQWHEIIRERSGNCSVSVDSYFRLEWDRLSRRLIATFDVRMCMCACVRA